MIYFSNFDVPGGGGGASATDWRVLFTDNHGSATFVEVSVIKFYDASDVEITASGGTILFSTQGGGAAANAFDGAANTAWASTSGSVTNQHLGYSWATAKSVAKVGLTFLTTGTVDRIPKNCELQYHDGSTWQTTETFKVTWPIRGYHRKFPEDAPAAGQYRAIKLLIVSTVGGTQTQIDEIEHRATVSGADQTSAQSSNAGGATGRITVSGEGGGNEGYRAYDNSTGSWFVSSGTNTHNTFIHPAPIALVEGAVKGSASTSRSPSSLKFQGSNDEDDAWTDLISASGLTWSAGETKTFT